MRDRAAVKTFGGRFSAFANARVPRRRDGATVSLGPWGVD